ncbi:hypothetical protein Ahy_B08g093506 [Arachis hypogaea]|uniref:Retrotransposon gag domain-containing protein n=1 Tax=Arachis hypogaea TaxID=3818 RepID=A0A444Y6B2_ARAHY|nr:hypothetical protein Ahy_B08g093506 [Arachis hypogaea]
MADTFEEQSPSHRDNSRTRNPTPEHQETTPHGRIASTIHQTPAHNKENDPEIPIVENLGEKASQIIQDLCLRVQEFEGRVPAKEKYHIEDGSHATSRSRSRHEARHSRSLERRHNRRNDRSDSRDLGHQHGASARRHDRSPERRNGKRHNRSVSRDPSPRHDTDDDRRHQEAKRTRNDYVIMGATPFTERILKAKLPKGFDKPTDMKYDGTKDPQEHLMAFEARMNLEGALDAVRCRAFPVTLAGPAIKCFNALPNGSITDFHDISQKFMAQFTTRITKAKHAISLLGVTQRHDESTRKYLDRFNDECLMVDGLTDSVASLCLTNGLMNEDFRKHLTTRSVWTMHEIQGVAKEYINDEEVS